VTESSVLNKIPQEVKDLSLVTTFWSALSLVGLLISLIWGTQYMWGGLLGILGVMFTTALTFFLSKHLGTWSSWGIFLIKLGVFATLFATPLFTINTSVWGYNISASTGPINVWSTIIIFTSVPLLSSFTTNFYINRKRKK
jgi:hypothetical protein